MIRPAAEKDLDGIEESYREHFQHEREHGAYTVFREGVYPTRRAAEEALRAGTLYVYEEDGAVLGSVILDGRQPEEYRSVNWPSGAAADKVRVIHLLMVRPRAAGKGVGTALVRYAEGEAARAACTALRLDTGAQNTPAVSLYQKLSFQLAAAASMKVGGAIPHGGHLFFEKPLPGGPAR